MSWDVIKKTNSCAVIKYEHNSNAFEWPWNYQAKQSFSLKDLECTMELTVKNKSNINMPVGFGIHPFFNFDDEIQLKFKAEKEWIGPPEEFPTKTKFVENNFNINDRKKLWKIQFPKFLEMKLILYQLEGLIQVYMLKKCLLILTLEVRLKKKIFVT